MVLALVLLDVEVGLLLDGGHHGGAFEALPHHVDSQRGGMCHFFVEITIVAQLVEDNLIGGEIVSIGG